MTHAFDVNIAKYYGIESAILIYNISYWILKNKANGTNFYDGRYWTYNSIEAWSELFPYMSKSTIRRALDKLIESGVLVKGNYNTSPYDKTTWYAFSDDKCICQNEQSDLLKVANRSVQSDKSITDITITDITTDSKQSELSVWPTFEDFWDTYQKKVDRPKCEKKWGRLGQADREKIMSHLPLYVASTPDVQFRKNPSTYLNNKSWENEVIQNNKSGFNAGQAINHIYGNRE